MKLFKSISALFLLQLFSLSSYAAEAPIPITTTTTTTTIKIPTTTTTTQPFRPQLPIDGAPHEKIVVSGCTASAPGCVDKSVMDIGKISAPCFGSKSLILRNKSDPHRYTYPPHLKHNDCQGSHPLSSLGSEFALVEKFIVGSEQRFIAALKAAPELVVDFNNDEIRNKLKKNGGKVPYTLLEAYVFGDLMNELAHPKTRTPESRAALRWLAKGSQAINLRTWDNAQKMYYEWKKDPCSFKLPDDFPQNFRDDFARKNKGRNLKVGCDFQNSIVSTAQSVYKITQVAQGNPEVEEFVKWGGYLTTKDVLFDRQDSFNETALSLTAISVISATAVAAAGGIAAFIAAATITTTVTATIGGVTGAVTGLAAVSAIMPFSGGIVAASSAAGAAVSGAMMGVGVFLGPLVIVVAAIAAITAAIGITVEDSAFHSTMQNINPPWDTKFVIERKLESMQQDVSAGKGGDLLFAFSDALSVNNSTKFLPFAVKIPAAKIPPLDKASVASSPVYKASAASNPLYKASATSGSNPLYKASAISTQVTAAFTLYNGSTYLFHPDGTYSKTSKGKTGIDSGYPVKMPGGWKGFPSSWYSGINAALPYQGTAKAYMFKGDQYTRLNGTTLDAGYPIAMPGGWQKMPASWNGQVDAALYFPPSGKHYMFKGNEYIRLSGVTVDSGYPAKLPGGWQGMPAEFAKGIDAATYRNGHAYMIKGDQYIRFTGTKMDAGYPKSIQGNWPN